MGVNKSAKVSEMPTISEAIKDRLTCYDFLTGVGVHIDRSGKARCPFHGEKTASLKVYEDPKRGWHCFGCGMGGSVIDLAMKWYGTNYMETTERLDGDFNLGLPIHKRLSREETKAINEEIERKRAERKARQIRAEAAYKAYLDALEAWMKNEQVIQSKKPQGHFDEPDSEWLDAKAKQPILKYELDCEEERWWKIRAEQKRGE